MNSHELQQQIRSGDREAFRQLYAACGQGVYLRAQEALGSPDAAREVVKQVFLSLHHEIQGSDRPLDVDARLFSLTSDEIRTRRVLAGDFSDAVQPSAQAETAAPVTAAAEPAGQTRTAEAAQQPAAPAEAAAASSPGPVPPPQHDPFAGAEPYRSPLERAEAYMRADPEAAKKALREKRKQRREREPKQRGNAVVTALIILFLLLFVWVLAGILMDLAILPRVDLGFRWFNEHIFPLFTL
ncbi:MAG: hypothetical protein Q4C13_04340 [Clostridia bacterium]|nr:hypothetical protein [Clostridia bacterium]